MKQNFKLLTEFVLDARNMDFIVVFSEWRKLHNEELNDLYSIPNIVRVVKWR